MPYKPTHIPYGLADPAKRIIRNPGLRDEANFTKFGIETNGEYFYVSNMVRGGGATLMHRHYGYGEEFYPVEGELGVVGHNGTKTMHLKKGQSYKILPGEWHMFFNPSKTEPITFEARVEPAHPGFEKILFIWYGLVNDGYGDKTGTPRNPLYVLMLTNMGEMGFQGLWGWFMGAFAALVGWLMRVTGEEERLTRKYYGKPVSEATQEEREMYLKKDL